MSTRRLPVVAVLVVAAVLVDLAATAMVYIGRRDAPALPTFRQASMSRVDWNVSPYAGRTQAFGFTVNPAPPASASPRGTIDYRGHVNPALNAVYALAALDRAENDGKDREVWTRRAGAAIDQVLSTAHGGLLPYGLADTDPFGDQRPVPDYSAATQGLVLSALARLHVATGDEKWRRDAGPIFAALLRFRGFFEGSNPAPEPWLSLVDGSGYLWFEHFTNARAPVRDSPDQLFTMLGLYDYRRELALTRDQRSIATRLLAGGVATLKDVLPEIRRPGQLAFASLAAGTSDPRSQMEIEAGLLVLGRILRDPTYPELSRRLDRDDNLAPFTAGRITLAADHDPFAPLPPAYGYTDSPAPPATVSHGVVLEGGRMHPGLTARYALAALDRFRTTGQRGWLLRSERAVREAMSRSTGGLVPYQFQNNDALGASLAPPWYSADAQGLMLAAATRLATVTRDAHWRRAAEVLFSTLPRFRDFGADGEAPLRPWISLVDDDDYLWFEAYPSGSPPSLVLHVQLSTLLALYDYWEMSHDPLARQMIAGGVSTVRHYLPRLRLAGRKPWDSLAARRSDRQSERQIEAQLDQLAAITGDRLIAHYASPRP